MGETSTEFAENLIKNIFKLWLDPEIEKRRKSNLLTDNFALYAAQVIMSHDQPNEVRLNEEVNARVVGNFDKPAAEGEHISIDDLESIVDMQLTDRDPNAGHVTMLVHRKKWLIKFDFRYNAVRSSGHLEAASEFLARRRQCLIRKRAS